MSPAMVLGLKANNRKSPSVQLDYRIHLQEIKPWPPSQSLRSLRSTFIQWEHGDKNSGSTNPVVPSLGSGSNVGDGKIELNQSFRLPVTLLRDMSIKGGDGNTFQKNCLEFNLYEPRRDKTVKGQLLATAIIDLADYGIVKEDLSIIAPMNCKRVLRNTAPPVLFIKIQRVLKSRANGYIDRNGSESVSALMNEEYAEEAEVASFTDDDVSSHSSTAVHSSAIKSQGGSLPQEEENGSEEIKEITEDAKVHYVITSNQRPERTDIKPVRESHGSLKESSSCSSSTDLSSDSESPENLHSTLSSFNETSFMLIEKSIGTRSVQSSSSSSSIAHEGIDKELIVNTRRNDQDDPAEDIHESTRGVGSADIIENGSGEDSNNHQESEQERKILDENLHHKEDEQLNRSSQDDTIKEITSESDALSICRENVGVYNDKSKHVKSVRSPMDSRRSNGNVKSSQFFGKEKDGGVLKDAQNVVRSSIYNGKEDAKVYPKDREVQKLERRIHMLEGELREAAAIEVSLYSVAAEHGSSVNKVHAPARRLSRLYLHACKENSRLRRASAARSAISGLVLVAKACGNDVPRLTFWLSNSVVLRAILNQAGDHQKLSSGVICSQKGNNEKSSALKWKDSFLNLKKETGSALHENFDDWEDLHTFTSALENVETWIFSRIVESIWWQTLTPHMQSAAANEIASVMSSISSKLYKSTSSLGEQEKGNFSLELWKKAFNDAYERICPIRAGGHECGCLPVLSRLIVEQCVGRLDVAMFNAILRESADEIPTDPVSDPITDPKVLPIPSGNASFGAGAQLKTAIGNWSRWLTDQFGIDNDDLTDDENEPENDDDNKRKEFNTSFKPFHLLHALSDLMMLPKDMLLCRSIRKEVCPRFKAPLIKQILDNFVPDEFCPDPIPDVVLEALESEDPAESGEDFIVNFPCTADPIVYLPPPATSVAHILGDCGSHSQLTRNGSLVLRKSYTSDDELDELDSLSIIDIFRPLPASTKPSWTSKEDGSKNSVRYQLLREVWMSSM